VPITTRRQYDPVTDRLVHCEGDCICGAIVDLADPMTNECSCCGRLYNGSGQQLRDPSQWQEPPEED